MLLNPFKMKDGFIEVTLMKGSKRHGHEFRADKYHEIDEITLIDEETLQSIQILDDAVITPSVDYVNISFAGSVRRTRIKLHHFVLVGLYNTNIHVDHVNRNKRDNRSDNLRSVTRSINEKNKPARYNSKTEIRGIYNDARNPGKFQLRYHHKQFQDFGAGFVGCGNLSLEDAMNLRSWIDSIVDHRQNKCNMPSSKSLSKFLNSMSGSRLMDFVRVLGTPHSKDEIDRVRALLTAEPKVEG